VLLDVSRVAVVTVLAVTKTARLSIGSITVVVPTTGLGVTIGVAERTVVTPVAGLPTTGGSVTIKSAKIITF
jgi:hypothetical protein